MDTLYSDLIFISNIVINLD